MKRVVALVVVAAWLLPATANAQKDGGVLELEPEHIQATLEQPADFIIQVDSIEYKSPELETSFVPDLLQSVTGAPF